MRKQKKGLKIVKRVFLIFAVLIFIGMIFPTWTPEIKEAGSISELRKVKINDEELQIMIRGCDRNNPILLFVHGGPCWPEIPYVVKYQEDWEEKFTVVHYDQRGSGKSYKFFGDYSDISAKVHVDDLIALTEYIREYLGQEQVILLGHSYGTYVGIQAAAERPDLYKAYVGIGQMSETVSSEMFSLQKCLAAAREAGNEKDVAALKKMEAAILAGEKVAPRGYVRKYGFAARKIDDNLDYAEGFLLRPEYNLWDVLCLYAGSIQNQDVLLKETVDFPISEIVTELEIPTYFVMGKYDGMTTPEAAEAYLENLVCEEKELVLFEQSAHFPQFEEKDAFLKWLWEEVWTAHGEDVLE